MIPIVSNLSIRARKVLVELIVDIVAAVYYLPKIVLWIMEGGDALRSSEMVELIGDVILLGIVLGIILSIVLDCWKKSEPLDERESYFNLKSSIAGYWSLCILVCLIIAQVAMVEYFPVLKNRAVVEWTPLVIANVLLLFIILSSMVKSAMLLFFYQRGY